MKRQILISSLILLFIQNFVSASTFYVPSRDYPTIQSAISDPAVVNGDVVVVAPGVYSGPGNVDLDFGGKAITVKSTINFANPNPAIIAATIIDCGGTKYNPHRAFWFHNIEGPNSKVLGFTIRNGYARGPKGADGTAGYVGYPLSLFVPFILTTGGDPNQSPPYALNGAGSAGDGYGGAILCGNPTNPASFASPTIQYCVIKNCTVTGAHGGKGADGLSGTWYHWTIADFNLNDGTLLPNTQLTAGSYGQWAGYGGSGSGNGYGGAIACLGGSSPIISNCDISDSFARGGRGGDGGAGGNAESSPPSALPPNYTGGSESFGGDANSSIGDGMGGGIYAKNGSRPIITNCTFSNNIAMTGPRASGGLKGQGNVIAAPIGPATSGTDGFVYSSGGIAGGAAYYAHPSDANFTGCTFTSNKAYAAYQTYQSYYGEDIWQYTVGGALYSDADNITLYNCEFIGNRGGAVYCGPNGNLNFDDCLFTDNSETANGGAVYIGSSCTVDLHGCTFGGNSAYDDGGALECRSNATLTNCSFGGNKADSDNDGYGYGGAMDAYEPGTTLIVDFNACSFSGNQAIYGGGFSSENFHNTKFTNCYFVGNTAHDGGGLDLVNGDFFVTGGAVKGNNATDGDGGGFDCWYTIAEIRNCTIRDNFADGNYPAGGNGGAINFYGGASPQTVFNCLITGNSAAVDGGAIFCSNATPEIGNCTFSGNLAGGYGGAIFSDFISDPDIIDCIFEGCNGHAIHEEDFGGNAIVKYSLFYNNPDKDYYESGTSTSYNFGSVADPNGNFNKEPFFVIGPLGNFYLNQTSSPAINSGSATAAFLGLNAYTTDANNAFDLGQVDRGYHYPISTSVQKFNLTASVVGGHGSIAVAPASNDSNYYAGTVVTLTATPNAGWRVKTWNGTDDDSSTATTNTVIMNSNKTVGVEFEQPRTLIVAVGGGGQGGYYSTIRDAISDANNGDTIVVYPGIYYGGYESVSVYVDESITIRSLHPDDPCCVVATVIDGYRQSPFNEGFTNIGVIFGSHTNANTIFNGFTIQNCGGRYGDNLRDGERVPVNHPNGYDGGSGAGAAVSIFNGGGPIIKNCVIRDNLVLGGSGGNGVAATGPPASQNAGRGGWGGFAWGGAVYCGTNSSPTFINCRIIDNEARGGNGGNGGDDAFPGGEENYGGNWSMRGTPEFSARDIDPYSSNITPVIDGDLWEIWGYIGDYRWYSGVGGGVFVDEGSNVTFIGCEISGNRAQGGMSGQGGLDYYSQRPEEPLIPYEMPTFGGGVYCAADSTVAFTGCTITDNISSEPTVPPNNRIDPYLGHGGGVCAEDTATLIFTNCTFSENDADAGGGIHFADANLVISDCNFTFNSAFHGGGLFGEHGPATILRSNFTDNIAFSDANEPNVLGAGGGLHFWATDVNIIDCNISNNQADASGGGVFFGGESIPSLTNCLLTNNAAGRDGGGVSTNIFSQLTISNCTIADNVVTGIGFEQGYGGGLYCSYDSYTNIINSIIWGNSGQMGPQLAIGTGFEYDPRPSTVNVFYSDIKGGKPYVFKDLGCTFSWDDANNNNIQVDPCFVTGPLGSYYLSQTDTNDPSQTTDSPCVDTGNDQASNVGLSYPYTTRTDEVFDTSVVDMGYHYLLAHPIELCSFCDLSHDGDVNLVDLEIFILHWLDDDCSADNDWCGGADLTFDTYVNFNDFSALSKCWLAEDTDAPLPNPSEWKIAPYSTAPPPPYTISMTAETAFDSWGGVVEYYFECVTGNDNSSVWGPNTTYVTTGHPDSNAAYGYRVKARDERGHETLWSEIGYAVTGQSSSQEDQTPPTPVTWVSVPAAVVGSSTSITMTSTHAQDIIGAAPEDTNSPPVQYYFQCTTDGDANSNWQASETYVATGLTPSTLYTFTVRARDSAIPPNETGLSDPASATTNAGAQQNLRPYDDSIKWATTSPMPPYETVVGSNAYANMSAQVAIDPEGLAVQYWFECVGHETEFNSGWINDPQWQVYIGPPGQGLRFHFKARDTSPALLESVWSTTRDCY
jgi:predicted outer membrane repeat protein